MVRGAGRGEGHFPDGGIAVVFCDGRVMGGELGKGMRR